MSAPTAEDLVEQIREVYAQARAAGQPLPGRPTLAKLTGATDYRVRVALSELAKSGQETGDAGEDAGDVGEAPGDDGMLNLTSGELAGDSTASRPLADHQPLTATAPIMGAEAVPDHQDNLLHKPVAGSVTAAGEDTTSPPTSSMAGGEPVPAGAKVVSWAGFVFGSIMSVAANVLHTWLPTERMPPGWSPGIASQIGAAVWPIGLLLSVEVLSRVPWRHGWQWALARFGGTGTVALGSAIISYGHVRDLLTAWGYGAVAAHVGPRVLDGLMVISGFALLAMSTPTETARPTNAGASPVGDGPGR